MPKDKNTQYRFRLNNFTGVPLRLLVQIIVREKFALVLFSLMSFFILAHTEKAANVESNVSSVSQSLVVYLSRTRNTAALARMIQQQTGAKLIAIKLEAPYPKNYEEMVEQVRKENASGFLPPLATQITDLADFDTVFIGFPTWGMELPPPMKSFIVNSDLSGKHILPFNTHAGYGPGDSFATLRSLCKGCEVAEGISVKGGEERSNILLAIKGKRADEVEKQLNKWLERVQLRE